MPAQQAICVGSQPARDISEPSFHHGSGGNREIVSPGNREFAKGEELGRFNMGSTATAMANMQAITSKYGPAPQSYLIVPLAGAFFIDLMNAVVLTVLLSLRFMGG